MIRLSFLFIVSSLYCRGEVLANSALQKYFEGKVAAIRANAPRQIDSQNQWETLRMQYRQQLFEMLGLSPLPAKSDLHAQITGEVEREGVVVQKLHFQSMPGLYVTANFYLPKIRSGPLPTILYLCGHAPVKTNGISYGNKVAYQHHGAWFARNGYACLTLDTIEAGEIEGEHHGTYNRGMWWWNSHGYTPAGVEAWNSIRALDYLETRPEVDKTRFGVTGRSGGGAYSWWIAALDHRIRVAAPVAGITDLENHVVDGVVEGHCDCMFFVNTYRWDYPLVAALVAPRPLLLCNSDKDTIFPLDGVERTHAYGKNIYDVFGASRNFGLLVTEGPHKDTQDLQVPVFRWFNRHLKGEDPVIAMAATKLFTPAELKVFDKLPEDEQTSRIHETFVARTPITDFEQLQKTLVRRTFGAWPSFTPLNPQHETSQSGKDYERRSLEFDSEPGIKAKLIYLTPHGTTPRTVDLRVMTEEELPSVATLVQNRFGIEIEGQSAGEIKGPASFDSRPDAITAFLFVRGSGSANPKEAIQIRRRYMLIGTTLDSMRVWDVLRGVDQVRSIPALQKLPLHISARGPNAANLLMYAAVAKNLPESITLFDLPQTDETAPDYLNYSRFTSMPDLARLVSATHPNLLIEN